MSHTLIVGRSGYGKTHYLLNYLKENCGQKYNVIYCILFVQRIVLILCGRPGRVKTILA